jgi:peroxiredoxin
MKRFCSSLLLALIPALLTCGVAPGAEEPKTLPIGAPAPDFSLPGVDGKTYSLSSFAQANLLVIVFTCNHCPTAQAYEDRIQKLADDYRNRSVALIAISPNDPLAVRLDELGYSDMSDSFAEMKLRAKDRKINFPYLYDGDQQKAARAYGPTATPHVFVFDKSRKLRYVGRIDNAEKPEKVTTRDTRNAIDALLAGKPVPVEKTKTFGCSIKWSDKREYVKSGLEQWAQEEVKLEPADEQGIQELARNSRSNKLRLINVWATWCGPCVVEFPELVAVNRMYRGREFEMVTISADSPDKHEQALAFLKKQQASSRNYIFKIDDKYRLVEALDKEWNGSLPYTMLVAPGGKVIYRITGPITPLELKKTIVGWLGRYYK